MSHLQTRAIFTVVVFLAISGSADAQRDPPVTPSSFSLPPVPPLPPPEQVALSPERLLVLEEWTRAYREWKTWFQQWHNRPEPGWFSARARRQPPDVPPWLPGVCGVVLEESGPLVEGCSAWRELERGDHAALVSAELAVQARAAQESGQKSSWWEHVHLDALWPMTQAGSSTFGLLGAHATLPVSGRFQVFVTPGVILLTLPSGDGGRTWSTATDWGFSIRVIDFRFPGMERPSSLHFNMARVWIFGTNASAFERELYLAGFSITFKKGPPGPR